MMKRLKLPLGIQTFSEIRQQNCYYVDKTAIAERMIQQGKHYFLSRPRRFGKSLFLDTLKELFEGNEPLFQGLAIHSQWNWTIQYPVLRFSFGSGNFIDPQWLQQTLDQQLNYLEQKFNLPAQFTPLGNRFADLIQRLYQSTQLPIVILIDEYDKPILDAIDHPEVAQLHREFLRGFYSTIKDYDAYIKFSLLTGVSKFSKVSLFSGLNNLYDITLEANYAHICGYTDQDIDTTFAPELMGLDRQAIRDWYNGYNWLGEGIYNPFDILQLFQGRLFKNYWFETGTPTFLLKLLIKRKVFLPNLSQASSDDELLSSFDIDYMPIETLMFQTGYLTIKNWQDIGGTRFYHLGYPNREVYQSLNNSLLQYLVQNTQAQVTQRIQLYKLLSTNDLAGLQPLFHAFFASIPYHWYTSNTIADYEGFYASVFYAYFAALGLPVITEDTTNQGSIDMTLQFNQHIYIFEFKVVELVPQGKALQQLKDKAYADKYRHLQQPIVLIGVEFSKTERTVVAFEIEAVI